MKRHKTDLVIGDQEEQKTSVHIMAKGEQL